ncbi:hypothetical protein BJY52DRAFT_1227281 [Lactarius psammicola]|nr:hypothetical protein BJY52DRAFT_1227281 [Lactarius psammicola]
MRTSLPPSPAFTEAILVCLGCIEPDSKTQGAPPITPIEIRGLVMGRLRGPQRRRRLKFGRSDESGSTVDGILSLSIHVLNPQPFPTTTTQCTVIFSYQTPDTVDKTKTARDSNAQKTSGTSTALWRAESNVVEVGVVATAEVEASVVAVAGVVVAVAVTGRGRGGYVSSYEIDGDFVVDPVPFHPRDNSWRGAAPSSARGYKRAGKGRGSGLGYEHDYSDSMDNSDYYYSRYSTPVQGASPGPGSFRGNGYQRGRGRWGIAGPDTDLLEPKDRWRKRHLESKLRSGNASLSQLLYEDRPFLKPITFVQSQITPTLFLRDEEIFKPVAEEAGEREASHVPTAERVYRIFHGGNAAPQPSESVSDEEELLEIDYTDLGRFVNEIEATAASSIKMKIATLAAMTAATDIAMSVQKDENQPVVTATEEEPTGFYIDTKPSPVQDSSISTNDIAVEHPGTGILGEDLGEDDDDEIIVYVAPHPRNGKLASAYTQSSPPDTKMLPPAAGPAPVVAPTHQKTNDAPQAPVLPSEPELKLWPERIPKDIVVPSPAPAPALAFKDFSFSLLTSSPKPTHRVRWPRRIAHRKAERNAMFGSFGAIQAEATLRELDPRPGRAAPRRFGRGLGWFDLRAGRRRGERGGRRTLRPMRWLRSYGVWASPGKHMSARVTWKDEARIRLEDADEDEEENEGASGSDGEDVDTELELADGLQGMLAVEGVGEDEVASRSSSIEDSDDDTSEDEEVTPKRSFQARLERVRGRTAGQPIKDMMRGELNQERELDDDLNSDSDSDIDDEDSYIAQTLRNRMFRAIHNGKFEVVDVDFIDSSPKRKRDKYKYIPAELCDQWERDRKKKAERKRLRELERAAAAGPFKPTKKKRKGKKERKAAQRAAAAAADVSLETVVVHMRRFVEDLGGAPTLELPTDGAARAQTRERSRGFWASLRRHRRMAAEATRAKGKAGGKIRPRDGELVGGAAPKIDGTNVGFQMLSAMGWEEGSRIGTVGGVGLDIPLVAVIKTTKLGLGASSHKG